MPASRWIRSAPVDTAVALLWVPFVGAAWWASSNPDALATVLSVTFLVSFVHQPLTLPLVYGDPAQRALHRKLYAWSPVVFALAIALGLWLSLAAVALVAGLWNAEHTLMQRYGLTRIYGRKAGQDDGRLERGVLLSWLVLAMVRAAADPRTVDRVAALPLGRVNADGVRQLVALQPWAARLLPVVIVGVLVLAARWLVEEVARYRHGTANPAKAVYLLSTATLFAVMLVDPVIGFVGYVGAHALEYFVIVHHALGSRFRGRDDGPLARVLAEPDGRRRFFGAYLGAVLTLLFIELRWGSPALYTATVLFLGGLHVFYDGFVWKLRREQVARGLVSPALAAS